MIYLIHQTIDATAEKFPDNEAVQIYDQRLTYTQLVERSNSLARMLQETGVRRGDRVGIYLGKSLETAVSIYGVMKAGAAYVPLDPSAPTSRIAYVIRDCGIKHIITQPSKAELLQKIQAENTALEYALGIEDDNDIPVNCISWGEIDNVPSGGLDDVNIIDQDLAYIIYTSGSTGNPKGIMHTHYSGLSFAKWAAFAYDFTATDRLTNQAPLHFDMSIFDFFASAVACGTTVIIPDEYMRMPASYSKLLADEKITTIFTVPFAISQLLFRGALEQRDLSSLRWIVFGGDTHSPAHIRQLMAMLPHTKFSHMYGPAETNGCTYNNIESLPDDPDEPIPIGRPCENMRGLVIDETDQPVAPGESGELLMRGPTLMQGYWNRPELNKKVFYRRNIFEDYQEVFYRTGDLVEILPDGQYKFIGRKDRQVKIRGYRVELDEIEMALMSHPQVEEAAAFPVENGDGAKHIEAAVKAKNAQNLISTELNQHIKTQLPWYAIPAKIFTVETFPRTPTGKINRRKLQAQAN